MYSLTDQHDPPNILIVDDEPLVRATIVRGLRSRGYQCLEAGSVSLALAEVAKQTPDAVVTDIRMPGATGLDLLLKLQERCPDTQVLMLTGFSSVDTAIAALTHGAFGYLTKPIDSEALHQQLQRALQHRRMLIERREYTQLLEQTVAARTRELKDTHEEMTVRLVRACCFRDQETGAHIRRVGLLSGALARVCGWTNELCERIEMAAPLHDIGKTAIPDEILCKPGRFTDQEFDIMKRHTAIGASLLDDARSPVLAMAREIALAHHERWDGAGYPHGLAGQAIPESARIVAVADVYDALSHDRVYRPAFSRERVLEMLIAGRGTQFDPAILDQFLSNLADMEKITMENMDHTDVTYSHLMPDDKPSLNRIFQHEPELCGATT